MVYRTAPVSPTRTVLIGSLMTTGQCERVHESPEPEEVVVMEEIRAILAEGVVITMFEKGPHRNAMKVRSAGSDHHGKAFGSSLKPLIHFLQKPLPNQAKTI